MKNHSETIPSYVQNENPIFILGISQRSGTNFLFDLLIQHPDCWGSPVNINEDFLIHHSEILQEYSKKVVNRWKQWIEKEGFENALCKSIGDGLVSFLTRAQVGKRFVTKTPSVRNLDQFFKFFPNANLIILVRDGRSVVESRVKTFGETYEKASRTWAEAAETILQNKEKFKKTSFNYLIVRYEDLCEDINGEMVKVLKFLKLDKDVYDFQSADNLPVRGSSQFHGKDASHVHWKPVKKTQEFKPLERWNSWERWKHEQFNCLAGKYLIEFGYEEKHYHGNRFVWNVWIRVLLLKETIKGFFRHKLSWVKKVVKKTCGEERVLKFRSALWVTQDSFHSKPK